MGSEQNALIHPTAIVAKGAVIGEGTSIGAFSIIGPNVVVGRENNIGPHVVVEGNTLLGDGNRIFQFASVGADPQDLKFKGEPSELRIGNKNIIRECVTLQPGTTGGGMLTNIGNGNLFMANSHVGHDSIVGNQCIFANGAALSGHVTVGDRVVVGGLSGIHQFVRLGDMAMIGAGAMVAQDIPPYCIAQGDRAKLVGLNRVGMERGGVAREEIMALRKAYRFLLLSDSSEVKGKTLKERINLLRSSSTEFVTLETFLKFIEKSERGISRPRGGAAGAVDSDTE